MKKSCLLIGLIVVSAIVRAQDEITDLGGEFYFDNETYSAEELDALIQEYAERPLIWAECRTTELYQLPLRDDLKQLLVELRQEHPEVRNWSELRQLGRFSRTDLAVLRLFITFDKPKLQRGYFTNYFTLQSLTGTPDVGKVLLRWRQSFSNRVTIGGVLERDAKEQVLADHWNCGGSWTSRQQNLQLIFGAYRIHWGNGLLYASNLMSTRTTDVTGNVRMRSTRMSNYWGSDENRYLFGAALHWRSAVGNVYLFTSRHRVDATIAAGAVTSYRYDGIHQSFSQLAAKDAVTESQAGVAAIYTRGRANLGFLVSLLHNDYPIAALDTVPQIVNVALFHRLGTDDWEINGELLYQSNCSYGLMENLIWSANRADLVLSLRHYASELFVPYGSALARLNNPPNNEQGIYGGLILRLRRYLTWSAYLDYYRALKTDQVTGLPAKGLDLVTNLNWRLQSRGQLLLTYRRNLRYYPDLQTTVGRDRTWNARWQLFFSERHSLSIKCILSSTRAHRLFENAALSVSFRSGGRYWDWQIGVTEYYVLPGKLLYLSEAGVPLQYNLTTLSGRGYHYFGVLSFKPVSRVDLAIAWQYLVRSESANQQIASLRGNVQLNVGL